MWQGYCSPSMLLPPLFTCPVATSPQLSLLHTWPQLLLYIWGEHWHSIVVEEVCHILIGITGGAVLHCLGAVQNDWISPCENPFLLVDRNENRLPMWGSHFPSSDSVWLYAKGDSVNPTRRDVHWGALSFLFWYCFSNCLVFLVHKLLYILIFLHSCLNL